MIFFKKLILVLLVLFSATAVHANPLKIRIWVGFNPGGPDDIIARDMQQQILAEEPSAKVTVEYAPGAGGVIALNKVANLPPSDTVEIVAGGGSNLLVATYLTKTNKNVDLDKDVKILTPILKSQMVLISGRTTGINSISSLKEASRTRNIKYASVGVGSMTFLTSAYLLDRLEIEGTNIPYQGMSQFYPDLIEGRIDYAVDFVFSGAPKVNSGTVLPIAVTGDHRSVLLPNVPTLKEQGVQSIPLTPWTAWFVSTHTSNEDVSRLRKIFAKILSKPDTVNRYIKLGVTPVTADDVANADHWYGMQKKIFKRELKKFNALVNK